MTVNGKQHIEIEINKSEQERIVRKFLSKMFDIPSERHYIDDEGNLVKWWTVGAGNHSWDKEEIVRKATANDKLYFKFIDKFDKLTENDDR